MKKIFILLLLIIPSIVFATNNEASVVVGEVDMEENQPNDDDKVTDVEIKWNNMIFTYNVENNYTWNSVTHEYIKNEEKKYWTNNGNNIIINNKTNKKISLYPIYKSDNKSITGIFDINKIDLDGNTQKVIKFELSGSLSKDYNNIKLGYITINLE